MRVIGAIIVGIVGIVCLSGVSVGLGWFDTYASNKIDYVDQKIKDRTNYDTRKKVEDTARASIASYKTDRATYEMYRGSEDHEKQSWAEQAKMRANKTANIYNEYMLKNSHVFEGNIPSDIEYQLALLN